MSWDNVRVWDLWDRSKIWGCLGASEVYGEACQYERVP